VPNPRLEAVKEQINSWSRRQLEHLAQNQAADDGVVEGTPKLRGGAEADGERHGAEKRGHRRHHDRAKTKQELTWSVADVDSSGFQVVAAVASSIS
jgi:hypothetical protein